MPVSKSKINIQLPNRILSTLLLVSLISCSSVAQTSKPSTPSGESSNTSTPSAETPAPVESHAKIRRLPRNFYEDQKRIWTSPAHLREQSLQWALPLTFATALSFGVDTHVAEKVAGRNPTSVKHASSLSNYGAAAFAGIVAGQYLWGLHTQNDKLTETGFLSGEAALNAMALSTLSKVVSKRERPTDGTGQGRFFESNSALNSSFVSQHSAAAFSIATVIAHEYPGPLTKLFAYGGASAIGIARVMGNKHFTSDVLLGSALGYFTGRQVFAAHAVSVREDESYGTFVKTDEVKDRDVSMMGSPYVAIDSWVYPAMYKLASLGLIRDALLSQRPWTRLQCAMLLEDVSDENELPADLLEIVSDLRREFEPESGLLEGKRRNLSARIESVYSRAEWIGGNPVNDAMHFAQTQVDDFGRPYAAGFNNVTGMSASANAGPFTAYVRAEYQHAPSTAAYSASTRTAISIRDQLPMLGPEDIPSVNRVRLLESYVGVNVKNWQLSFGRQSMWWGPGQEQDLIMSNNAEPLTGLRLSTVSPMHLPLLGTFASTTYFGQTRGYHYLRLGPYFQLTGSANTFVDPQPFLWGQKLDFKPTENFEFGVTITTVLGGEGRPMTLETFKHSFSHSGNAQPVEPGDRRTGFNFSYRLPGLRRWLTLYSGSMSEDEPLPLFYPRRSSMSPGLYLVRVPKLNKLDFRIESVYTDIPDLRVSSTALAYLNQHYAGGYTVNGNIIGSWVGPEGRAIQARSTYWFAPERKLSFSFRTQHVNPDYIGGGDLKDVGAQYEFKPTSEFTINSSLNVERLNFPVLSNHTEHSVSLSVQLSWNGYPARRR